MKNSLKYVMKISLVDTTNDQDTTCTSSGICSCESSHNDIDESTSTTSDNSTFDKVDTKETEVPKPKKAWTKRTY